jgi:uncharacterized phage protein (TIGR01671 family)
MKNNLKFRVWDFSKKKFYFYSGIFNLANQHQKLLPPGSFEQFNKIEIQQFTGLKDKNNKEIYEGDIVSTFYRSMGWNLSGKNKLGVITWKNKSSCFKICRDKQQCGITNVIEIVGNIFENPELLK